MADLGEISAKVSADTSNFTSGIDSATDVLGGLTDVLAGSKGKILGLAAAASAAAAGGLAAATQQAMKLERTLRGAAARAGATQSAFQKFGKTAKQASLDSAFGANQAAKAQRQMAKAGLEVSQINKALPGVLRGATAAGMEAADMGEIATNAMRAFGKSSSEVSNVMDVLTKASINANTSVSELGQGIATAGGIASSTGQTLEETIGIIATMQNAGVQASKASTALKSAIAKLASPTAKAEKTLDKLGISVRDSSGNIKSMVDILGQLKQAGAGAADMAKIFGKRAGPTLQTALQSSDGELQSFVSSLNDAEGTAKKVAGFIRESLSEQVKVLTGSLATLGANIGDVVLPPLKLLVGVLQKTVSFLNTMVSVVKDTDSMFSGWNVSLKDTAKSAGDAAKSTKGMGKAASAVQSQLKGQKNAQDSLNKSLKKFVNLQEEAKRGAFDKLKSKVKAGQAELESMRESMQTNKELLAATAGGKIKGMQSRFGDVEVSEQMKEDVKRMEDLGILEDERKKASRELKKQRVLINKKTRHQNRLERKLMSAADAKLKKQKEENRANQTAVNQEKQKTKELRDQKNLKQKIKESTGEGETKSKGVRTRGSLGASGITQMQGGGAGRTAKDPMGKKAARNYDKAKRKANEAKEANKEAAKAENKRAEASKRASKATENSKQDLKKLARSSQRAVSELGAATSSVAKLAGASNSVAGGIDTATQAAVGLLGTMQAVHAATSATAAAMAGVTGGLSLLGTVAGGIIAAKNAKKSGGKDSERAKRARKKQDFRKLADMIGKSVAQNMKEIDRPDRVVMVGARNPVQNMSEGQVGDLFSRLERHSKSQTGTNLGG